MGAGADGTDYLLGLGSGKNELNVGWRFFNNLQQGVEALSGNHVGLIEDKNLVAISHWSKNCALT
jgi:hypothetical protein